MNLVHNRISLFLFAFLFSDFKFGQAILCYDCNSLFDPRCGDNFDPFSLGVVNCSLQDPLEHLPDLEPTVCRTIKMEIYGKTRVVRQCGFLKDPETDKPCYKKTNSDQLYITYCSCTSDLCNHGGSLQKNVVLGVVLIGLLCLFNGF